MWSLLQPTHLLFVLLIVLIIFGPGKLPALGRGLGKGIRDFRDILRDRPGDRTRHKGALFMASGVDPEVGRDVGDQLPDEEAERGKFWVRSLLAVLIGNTAYFLSSPLLPSGARMSLESQPWLAALVDAWLCVFAFGALSVASAFRKRGGPKR